MAIVGNLTILMTADVKSAERDIRSMSAAVSGVQTDVSKGGNSLIAYSNSLDTVKRNSRLAKDGIGFLGNTVSLFNPAMGTAINNVERLSKDIGQLTDVAKAGGAGMQIFKAGVAAAVAAMALKITVSIADWVLGVQEFNKELAAGMERAAKNADLIAAKLKTWADERLEIIDLTTTGQERINALTTEELKLKRMLADADNDAAEKRRALFESKQWSVQGIGRGLANVFGSGIEDPSVHLAEQLKLAEKNANDLQEALLRIQGAKTPFKSELDSARDIAKLKDEGLALTKAMQTPFETFTASLERIVDLATKEAIDETTAERAIQAEVDKVRQATKRSSEAVNSQAIIRGTAAALSPFLKRSESQSDPVNKEILAAQRQANAALTSIDRKLKPNSIVFTPVSF